MGLFCILSPIFVNWVGVKKTLIFGTLGWSVYSAALYQNNRYGTEWFVIFGAAICGVSAGLYWAAEGAIVLSYPEYAKRGRYLALWLAFKNSGQLIGGAINLGLNASRSGAGKVSYVTILVFVGLQASAVPFSFALSPPEKTERPDGSKIVVEKQTSAKEQLRRLWKTVSTRQIGLLLPIFFSCWFYWVRLNEIFFVFFLDMAGNADINTSRRAMLQPTSPCTFPSGLVPWRHSSLPLQEPWPAFSLASFWTRAASLSRPASATASSSRPASSPCCGSGS